MCSTCKPAEALAVGPLGIHNAPSGAFNDEHTNDETTVTADTLAIEDDSLPKSVLRVPVFIKYSLTRHGEVR
jgi:hypothetical protein